MEMMRDLAHERGRAVLTLPTTSVLEFADRTIRIEDGMIVNSSPELSVPVELLAQNFHQPAHTWIQ